MLSIDEIKRFMLDDAGSEKKKMARQGEAYYEGRHDILDCRLFYYNADGNLVEDKYRSNIKICHPFFTELAEQLTTYMLSFDENPIQAKETVEGLQEHLDFYFDAEFWDEVGELITGAYTKGFEYMHAYMDETNKLVFECADSMGVVEVREQDTDDHCAYVIYWYVDRIEKGHKKIKRIQVWDSEQVYFYVQTDEGEILVDDSEQINPRPHTLYQEDGKSEITYESFGLIPFFRLDNNRKQFSGLRAVKAMIDDYDRMQCGLSNNLVDFDTPIHVVSGYDGHDEEDLAKLQQNIKTKKIIGVDEGGNVEVKTVDIPYEARKMKADEDEKNIYRAGFGFNSAQVGDGNITNIVLKSRYTLLEMKAQRMESRLKKFLKKPIKMVLDAINAEHNTGFQITDVKFDFKRKTTTNETEDIQNEKTKAETKQIEVNTILNVAANIGDEQTLKAICEAMDWEFEEIQAQVEKAMEEQSLQGVRNTLEGAVIENEETNPETIEQNNHGF